MCRIVFIFLVFICCKNTIAQTITVTDAVSKNTLSNTTIYNTQKKIILTTDKKGMADISSFSATDTMFFEHEGYITRPYNANVLKMYNYKINLFPDAFMEYEMVNVFSLFPVKRNDITANISLLTEQIISASPIQSSLDLLKLFGNISVRKENQILGGTLLNGCNSNNSIYLLDGITIHSLLPVNVYNIERIELINYSNSVISGNNSTGSTMYFKTQKPQLSFGDSTPKFSLNACTQISSINSGLTANVNVNMRLKNWASITSLSITNFNSYKTGNNRSHGYSDWGKVKYYTSTINGIDTVINNKDSNLQPYTGYKQSDINQTLLIKINPQTDVCLFVHFTQMSEINNQNMLYSNDTTNTTYAEWFIAPQKYLLSYAKLHSWKKQKLMDEYFITFSFEGSTDEKVTRRYQSIDSFHYINNKQYYSLHADFLKLFKTNSRINYGLELNNHQLQSNANIENINTNVTQNISPEYPDGGSYWQDISGYVNYNYHINSKLILNLGTRIGYYSLTAVADDSIYTFLNKNSMVNKKAMASGIAAISYKFSNRCLFNNTFSSSYHLPDESELLRFYEAENYIHLPNITLKPSYSIKNELGLRMALFENQLMIYPTLYFAYQYNAIAEYIYATLVFNHIDSIQLSHNVNIDKGIIYGASYQLTVKMGEYAFLSTNLFYTKGIVVETKKPLPYISPLSGKTGISYNLKSGLYSFFILYNGAKNINSYSDYIGENKTQATQDGIPVWFTLNLSTRYSIYKNITLCLAIENILDKQYKTYGSNSSAEGRNIVVSLRSAF